MLSGERKKLIRHACRTLLKNGDKNTLKVFGFKQPKLQAAKIVLFTPKVLFGEALQFSVSLSSISPRKQSIMMDYIIHHVNSNGKTSAKVFKWKTFILPAYQSLNSTKKHTIKKITTRVYYTGTHSVEIMVNGISVATNDFQLLIP